MVKGSNGDRGMKTLCMFALFVLCALTLKEKKEVPHSPEQLARVGISGQAL